jgi:acyl-[acyl-carrier-protein]-phospholipid O-acyltransferase / long-chain-fatty-acid--[acyl-carrier-protein] ligase
VAALLAKAREQGIAEVMVPRVVVTAPAVPVLATGKPDYPAVKTLAEEKLAAKERASG